MILKSISLAVTGCILAAVAFAQGEPQRQPAPELSKLEAFVGTWKSTAKMSVPGRPATDFTATDSFEWQKGKFFLIGHSEFTSAMGPGSEIMIFGYDPARAVYTYESFNSSGEHEIATGTLSGDTWTWKSGDSAPFKWRYTEKLVSPTSLSVHFEMSPDGTNWLTMLEGASTKQ
jgi:hypothetical protein